MQPLEKFLIRNTEGTPTHIAKVFQDTDYERPFDENYGVGVITNAYMGKSPNTVMDESEGTPTVYYKHMEPQRKLDDETVVRIICDCVNGLYAPANRDDVCDEWEEVDKVRPDYDPDEDYYKWAKRRDAAVDKIMAEHAEKFMADNGIVWDTYDDYYSDSPTWLVFSTTKMREAAGIEHDKAKDIVKSHIKELRQINEGEVYGYEVCELVEITDIPSDLEDIIEESDLTIEHDGKWYKMTDEESCWGFVGYESHEQTIKDNFLPAGDYKFSTLK